jgi:hypothetical protein
MNRNFLQKIIPFIPLLAVLLLLLIKPYYIFPTTGDTDFHLIRAQELIQSPLQGLFWDYLPYSPNGRALWHPPLFHSVLAFLWYLGGLRFAHSFLCVFQIILTVFVASWVAKKDYGLIAGFFAGLLTLATNRIDILTVPLPATYIPILSVLTIHYLPKNKFKAFLASLLGVWTHMMGLVIFIALFMVDGIRNKKNLKMILLLLPSIIFWIAYWIIFRDKTGATNQINPLLYFPPGNNLSGLIILLAFGFLGLYWLYNKDKERFKLYSIYILLVILIEFIFEDFARGFSYASLPLAILAGFSMQKIYNHCKINYKRTFANLIIVLLVFVSIIGASPFFISVYSNEASWDYLNIPFETNYTQLNSFIYGNTDKTEVIWAESTIADKIIWMTGRKISNGKYGKPTDFQEQHQKINIYASNDTFIIKDYNNNTLKQIPNAI